MPASPTSTKSGASPEGFRNPAQSAPEPMPWAGFSLGRRRPANLERPIVVVLGLNLLLLLLLHHGPRSALIGYILPQPRHLDQQHARLLGHARLRHRDALSR